MKRYSKKFWIAFWLISVIFLGVWFLFWQIKNRGVGSLDVAVDYLPIESENKGAAKTVVKLADFFTLKDDREKIFLILFENNLEIRPGGGFIGAFGILKIKNGRLVSIETHDLSNFDGRIPDGIKPPYPMEEMLRIKSWKMRDSNYSPDFPTNARKAEEFYYLGRGEEKFDGIIAVTTNVLASFLKVTGPIEVAGYPGTYDSNNAAIALEYQVEKGFDEQGIERGERKSVMGFLAKEILGRVDKLTLSEKWNFLKVIFDDLKRKDIQIYLKNKELAAVAREANWDGAVDENWRKDYLMMVDANLGAYKSDYYMKRSVDYSIDLSKDEPEVKLRIAYKHTAQKKDWMTNDYRDFLRVYVPDGSWLTSHANAERPVFGSELGKKYLGFNVFVPVNKERTVEINYKLPKEMKTGDYDLKIQKQPGLNDIPVAVHVKYPDGSKKDYDFTLNSDIVLSQL